MNAELWPRVRSILEHAFELAPEDRPGFLDIACHSNPELRREVEELLAAASEASDDFLESAAFFSSTLNAGDRIGDYEVESRIGAGGMGVVYRARDLRLGRAVAIKVLRAHLSVDPKRLRQFEQEAKAAAAINHPNILAVYQMGMFKGAPYLVSEYLEGETLRDELRRGPLAQPRLLELAEQMADGLSSAHQRGIIHRDLKPENLHVSSEGRVRILDFGLAKLLERDEQVVRSETRTGGVAGTAAYLSPEQIRGEKLDPRTDVFSLGVTLCEMCTGRRPFDGETSGLVIDAILNRHPQDPAETNPQIHPELSRIISKALEKDREVRYQSAAEIRADIRRLRRDLESGRYPVPAAAPDRLRRTSRIWLLSSPARWAIAILVAGIAIWIAYPLLHRTTFPADHLLNLHAQIDPPAGYAFRMSGDNAGPPVISPNGEFLAFTATGRDGRYRLWVRSFDSIDSRPLADTEGASFPFWSPDSDSLGFFAGGKLKTIGLVKGSPAVVCDATDGRGGAWGNGEIVFTPSPTSPLFRVNAAGGVPRPVTKLEGTEFTTHRWPIFLPDRIRFLYFAANHEPSKAAANMVYVASLAGDENRPLFHSDTNAILANGYLLSVIGSNLMAHRFDIRSRRILADPLLLARGAVNDTVTWHADVSASNTGVLLYGGTGASPTQLVWLDNELYTQTGVAVDDLSSLFLAELSPRNNQVVLQKDNEGHDVSVFDLNEKTTLFSLPKSQNNSFPVWSADGKRIVYGSYRNGRFAIYSSQVDGSSSEEEILSDSERINPRDLQGDTLLYFRGALGHEFQCWTLSLKTRRRTMILDGADDCRLSPDGRWLAFASRETVSGKPTPPLNIFVTRFPGGQAKYQVSGMAAIAPRWSLDGRELFFLEQSTLSFVRVQVRVERGIPRFHVLNKSGPNLLSAPVYAVSPDKKHILIDKVQDPTVVLITDLASDLSKR
jgi:hypothetical protein